MIEDTHDALLASVPNPAAPPTFAARFLLAAVHVYQMFFSVLMPCACKFYPSCSRYAAEAVRLHGARRGSWLALRRLGRCHPFSRGGVDLVPDPEAGPCLTDDARHDSAEPQGVRREDPS